MKFADRFSKFMYGRYGPDDLYKFLFELYIVLLMINLFVNSSVLSLVELLIVCIMFYRLLSKKIYKRSAENTKFLKVKKWFLKPFQNIKRNIKDKDHVYKKCHHCKTTLKLPLPLQRGIKHVVCPSCKEKNTFIVLKKLKIEIIKNNERKII